MAVGSCMNDTHTPIEPLLETCCEEALVYRDLSKVTIQWWSQTTHFLMRATGATFIEELTADRLRQFFFEGRTQREWSATTYINYFRALNAFFKWCETNGHIEVNPLADLSLPRAPKRVSRSISEEDARLLLDASFSMRYSYRYERFRNHAFISMLLFTGLRLSEALNLGVNDVDFEKNVVTVRAGKWKKDRVVPMLPELRQSVRKYLKERDRLKKQCSKFFVSLRGGDALTASGVRGFVRRLRKATGVNFSPHVLRHTFCTLMANGDVDLLALQHMMGHNNIETTMRYTKMYGSRTRTEILKHPLSGGMRTGRKLS